MDIFTVAAKLKLDSGEFEKNLRKMDREGKSFADSLKNTFSKVKKLAVAVGSAFAVKKVADGLWSVANAAAQAGDKIDKQSQALGMSRKAYQEWEYILSQSGASIDSMGVSMKTLNSAILEGSDDTRQALSKLHLSTTELKHMSQEDAFKKVVEAFQKIPAGAKKSALAVQLFGRNGQELLPLLNSSTESIDELRKKANELGLVMSDDDVNAAVAFGDALDTLKRTFTSFKYRFGAQILPALTSGMGKITDYAGKLRKAYDARGFAGVFDTVVSDVKNIKWPSWSDVRAAAEAGWETIKKGVAGLGKLVFGENEKGEVKWPTWDDVSEGAIKLWDNVKAAVADFGGLVFGKNEKGEVNWPTIEDMQNAAKDLWGKLKTFVADAFNLGGKLIFGENTDGEVNYPTWDKIGKTIRGAWDTIVAEAGKLSGFVLGNIGDASTAIAGIEEKWNELKTTVTTNAIDFISGLTGTDSATAENILNTLVTSLETIGAAITTYSLVTALPTVINAIVGLFSSGITAVNPVAIAIGAIAAAGVLIYKNWDGIQKFFEDLWSAVSTAVSAAWGNVQNWWTKDILGPVQQKWNEVSSFITGIWGGITGAIQTAIDKINEFFGLSDDGFTTESGQHFTGSSYDMQSQGQSGPQRNRTVTGTASEDQMQTAKPVEVEAKVNTSDVQEQLNDAEFLTQVGLNPDADPLLKFVNNLKLSTTIDIYPNYKGGSLPKSVPGLPGLTGGNDGAPKAIGDWNVPYDNYPALLHRNEMVLTATQARQYREGSNGFDLQGFAQAVIGAVRAGMENASVNAYVNGRKLTKEANRGLFQDMKGRRFAG